jgi:transposase
MIIGHTGDVSRFKSAAHFASYNGTAPIEASSGERRGTGSTSAATGN